MNAADSKPLSSCFTHQDGISLVEIMVALTLSLLLTGGALSMFLGSRQVYRTAEAFSRIQENARYAFEILGRDLRGAGYRGCAGDAATLTNTLNDSSSFLWNFGQPIYGYDAATSGWNVTPDAAITSPLSGRDIIVLRSAYGSAARVLEQPGGGDPGSANLKVTAGSGLKQWDIVLVTDCLASAILQITDINTAGDFDNSVHNTGEGSPTDSDPTHRPGNATKALGKNFEGGEIQRMSTKMYYIRTNPAGQPALYRKEGTADAAEMVEGVQDMQILYGVDENGDAAAERYETAQWVENNGRWGSVVAAKINLLLRSTENGLANAAQTYRFNGASVTATDLRLYQPFETTFALRNRVN